MGSELTWARTYSNYHKCTYAGAFHHAASTFFNIFSIAVIFAYIWLNFLRWYFEVGIVTNERIVDIEFKSILYKEVSITNVDNIEEISSRSGGYIGALFNYGNVHIKTAGANEDIEFMNVPNPTAIIKLINRLTDASSTIAH